MANPNHDPRTGKFTSGSGLNRANSSLGQRGKARIKEGISAAGAFAAGAAGVAVAGVGMALLQGVTRPVRTHSTIIANKAINAGIDHAEKIVAKHGPTIAKAVQTKGSAIVNHVRNMKLSIGSQHKPSIANRSASSNYRIAPNRHRPSRNH